jgi:hypothetical protein
MAIKQDFRLPSLPWTLARSTAPALSSGHAPNIQPVPSAGRRKTAAPGAAPRRPRPRRGLDHRSRAPSFGHRTQRRHRRLREEEAVQVVPVLRRKPRRGRTPLIGSANPLRTMGVFGVTAPTTPSQSSDIRGQRVGKLEQTNRLCGPTRGAHELAREMRLVERHFNDRKRGIAFSPSRNAMGSNPHPPQPHPPYTRKLRPIAGFFPALSATESFSILFTDNNR